MSICHIHFLNWRHYSTLCFNLGFNLLFTFYPERALKCMYICTCDICVTGTQRSITTSIALKFRDHHRTTKSSLSAKITGKKIWWLWWFEVKLKQQRQIYTGVLKTKIRTIIVLNWYMKWRGWNIFVPIFSLCTVIYNWSTSTSRAQIDETFYCK